MLTFATDFNAISAVAEILWYNLRKICGDCEMFRLQCCVAFLVYALFAYLSLEMLEKST